MAIPVGVSGLRAETVDFLLLNAGTLYKNVNKTMLEVGDADAFANAIDPDNSWTDWLGRLVVPTKLGATRGGTTVRTNKVEEQVEADGKRNNIVGLTVVQGYDPRIVTNLLEVGSINTLRLMLGGATETDAGLYRKLVPKMVVDEEDYIANILLAATVTGSGLPVLVLLEFARAMNPSELPLTDRAQAAVAIEFVGHQLAENALVPPITYYWPEIAGGS